MTSRPKVCIVDAMSSAMLLPAALRRRGFDSIHVQTQDPIPPVLAYSFVPKDHVANFVHDGNLDRTVNWLHEQRPVCVIPGTETGVLLADALAERLGLVGNGTALSLCRRNKVAMQQRLELLGLRSIPTCFTSDWPTALAWIEQRGRFPIVLKPPASAATDNVFISRSLDQAHEAFNTILTHKNVFGETSPGVVVQAYMHGKEYILDNATCAGHHYVTTVWRVEKVRTDTPVYDYGLVVSPLDEPQDRIVAYAKSVLDALGVRVGASHMEIMLTDDGPVLIEMGARLGGQKTQIPIEAARGISQLDSLIDAYLNPEQFFVRAKQPYPVPPYIIRVELICPRSGILRGLPRLESVRNLPSFFQVQMSAHVGEKIDRTTDFSVPGFVDLIGQDLNVLDQDYRQIRSWEATDFYEIE